MRPAPCALVLLLVPLAGCLDGGDPDIHRQGPNAVGGGPSRDDVGLAAVLEDLFAMPELRLETNHGSVRILLYDAWLPNTTAHIAALAGAGFYDGTTVHRVVDDFVLQGGDPSGTGQLGSGTTVPLEQDPRLRFAAGSVGLARDVDPDSGDSQYFITETPQPHLTDPQGATGQVFGTYALFGQVFEGLDVVRAIAAEPTVPGADRPVEDVVLERATLLPPPAGVELLDVVRALQPPVEWTKGTGMLDRSLWPLAGRPLRLLAHDAGAEGQGFDPAGSTLVSPDGLTVPIAWNATTDPGTWEATVVLPRPGTWVLAADACERCMTIFDVFPWHDAYAAFV